MRFMVLWSPKSACTTALIWFLNATGKLDEASRFHAWPHKYRSGVLYRWPVYRRLADPAIADMRRIRIIRDPLDRAVSSYRHAVSRGYTDAELSAFLKRRIDPNATFSFREFIDYLETVDIERTNTHHRVQFQAIEAKFPPTDVINITRQDLFTELNRIEAAMGLPVTDFPSLAWLHQHEHRRRPPLAEETGREYDLRPSRAAGRGHEAWPPTAALLTDDARERLARVYRIDLEAYAAHL
jgi:hypothetical protein